MSKTLERLIRGDPYRRTRLHDARGNLLDPAGFLGLPPTLLETVLRLGFGWRRVQPWLGRRAINAIEHLLTPQTRALEFGCGLSTIWLAQRCATVTSIEGDPSWHRQISARIRDRRLDNVNLELRDAGSYPDLTAFTNGAFDFILIDGDVRTDCARAIPSKVAPGGHVYVDNCDNEYGPGAGRAAGEVLLEAAGNRLGRVRYFTDLVPAHLLVVQGMLVTLTT